MVLVEVSVSMRRGAGSCSARRRSLNRRLGGPRLLSQSMGRVALRCDARRRVVEHKARRIEMVLVELSLSTR